MAFTQLFVWVEGPDDQRFVDSVLRPQLEAKYQWINVIPYAGMRREKVARFIESIRAMDNATYFFLADQDSAPCISATKKELMSMVKSLQERNIAVVAKEIESWYLAGLTKDGLLRFGMEELSNTDQISKEQFDTFRPAEFDSRIEWMVEMLRYYSLVKGASRNTSLRHFMGALSSL